MSKIKDYSIIETEWIENQIKSFEHHCELSKETNNEYFENIGKYKLSILNLIKSKLKPLTPIIKNTFEEAREFDSLDGVVDIDVVLGFGGDMSDLSPKIINSEDYINNTIIE